MRSDSTFDRSVVYLYEESPQHVAGLVINKPTRTKLQKIFQVKGFKTINISDLVYSGGPVNQGALVLLHTDEWQSKNTAEAGRGYRISSDDLMLEKLSQGNAPIHWRMMSGFSAWAPNQLNMEINGVFPYKLENRWLTCKANDSIIFEYDGEEQWQKCLSLATKQMVDNYF